MNERLFNFRHVAHCIGMELSKERDWRLGRTLRDFAARKGVQPERILAHKTNPNPSVKAKHVIAHYPMAIFIEACEFVKEYHDYEARQLTMFDVEPATSAPEISAAGSTSQPELRTS